MARRSPCPECGRQSEVIWGRCPECGYLENPGLARKPRDRGAPWAGFAFTVASNFGLAVPILVLVGLACGALLLLR